MVGSNLWSRQLCKTIVSAEPIRSRYYNTGDRIKTWGRRGAIWGGLWALLTGSAFCLIPGIGPILVAGPIIAGIVTAIEGAVIVAGLSAIGAALNSIGIPKDSIIQYETHIKAGHFLVVAHAAHAEVDRAKRNLASSHHIALGEHSCPS
jgi:hypothetical protein